MAELDIIEKAKNNSIIFTTAELNNPDVKGSFVYASPGFYQGDKKPTQTMSLGAIKLVLSDERMISLTYIAIAGADERPGDSIPATFMNCAFFSLGQTDT